MKAVAVEVVVAISPGQAVSSLLSLQFTLSQLTQDIQLPLQKNILHF